MISERLILDGESLKRGQEATGQRNYCPCRYDQANLRCTFSDLPNLRSKIYEAEMGLFDEEPAFRQMIMDAYWRYIEHEAKKNKGLAYWKTLDEKKIRKHAGHELGAREFTLTYSPQWCSDVEARKLMTGAVERIMKYYANEICELQVVGEVTKQGCSHIHGYYLLHGGKKITDKNFKRAYKFWNPKQKLGKRGHAGGHHEVVKNESDFKGYIDKCPDAWYKFSYNREEHSNVGTEEDDWCSDEEDQENSSGEEDQSQGGTQVGDGQYGEKDDSR